MRAGNTHNFDNNETIKKKNIYKTNKVEKKHVISMIIWLFIAVFIVYQAYKLVMYTLGKEDKEKMWLYNCVNSIMSTFAKNDSKSNMEEYSLKFAGIGDIYLTSSAISAAKNGSTYDFSAGTDKIAEELNKFDIVVASLSTPVADKSLGYTANNSIYNSPVSLLDTLKKLKISVVATATCHAMDKNESGISATIKNLKDASIDQVGINLNKERNNPVVISKNEISIGIVSYATKSNVKIPTNKSYLVNMLDEDILKQDIDYLKSKNVDYIIAYLNDPNEDSLIVSGDQKKNVEMLFNSGVNVVLGTGSMVVQGHVEDQVQTNNGSTNYVYSIYSLGDFFGSYSSTENQSNVIANIEFTKKINKNKKGEIKDTVVDMKINTPIFIWTTLSSSNIKTMYIMKDEIEAYNSNNSKLSKKEYNNLNTANERLNSLFQ